MLQRKISEESLATLLNTTTVTPSEDAVSLFSGDTVAHSFPPIFQHDISAYSRARELPVVSGPLKSELLLYPSLNALQDGAQPLMSIQPNKLHFLKKNTPLLTTHIHRDGHKSEFCKVYFKILQNNLTCYVLMFASGRNLVLYNNALKPHSDAIYKDTKMRVCGASGAASTFGNGAIKVFALDDASASLADGVDLESHSEVTSVKDMHLTPTSGSRLYDAVVHQRRNEVSRLLTSAQPIVPIPVAAFIDNGGAKVDGGRMHGSVRMFETAEGPEDELAEDSLVLCTVMLLMVEQEFSKMRGHKKPSYV